VNKNTLKVFFSMAKWQAVSVILNKQKRITKTLTLNEIVKTSELLIIRLNMMRSD
jgi:hypothetical protein